MKKIIYTILVLACTLVATGCAAQLKELSVADKNPETSSYVTSESSHCPPETHSKCVIVPKDYLPEFDIERHLIRYRADKTVYVEKMESGSVGVGGILLTIVKLPVAFLLETKSPGAGNGFLIGTSNQREISANWSKATLDVYQKDKDNIKSKTFNCDGVCSEKLKEATDAKVEIY